MMIIIFFFVQIVYIYSMHIYETTKNPNIITSIHREHFQWNMDLWGVSGVEAEVELLAAMVLFFQNIGLTHNDVVIKVTEKG